MRLEHLQKNPGVTGSSPADETGAFIEKSRCLRFFPREWDWSTYRGSPPGKVTGALIEKFRRLRFSQGKYAEALKEKSRCMKVILTARHFPGLFLAAHFKLGWSVISGQFFSKPLLVGEWTHDHQPNSKHANRWATTAPLQDVTCWQRIMSRQPKYFCHVKCHSAFS